MDLVLRSWAPIRPGSNGLTPREKVVLTGEILATYAAALRRLRGADVRMMAGWARDCPVRQETPPEAEARRTAVRLGRIVGRVLTVLPTDSRCLVKALVLARLLSRRGVEHVIVIGVRPGAEFEAHAWVECAARPVLPAGDYERLLEL